MKRISKSTNTQRLTRFLEEFSWLLESYSDLDLIGAAKNISNNDNKLSEAKVAVGNYESSNPNKHFLVGVLPRLFTDQTIFPTNDDISQFAKNVMDVSIPYSGKKSKYEIIGHIVCQTDKLNDYELTKLVKALAKISNNDSETKELIKMRKKENYSWNDIIQELAGWK